MSGFVITIRCTWPGCKRSIRLPAKTFRCRVHEKMARLMAANAARKTESAK